MNVVMQHWNYDELGNDHTTLDDDDSVGIPVSTE